MEAERLFNSPAQAIGIEILEEHSIATVFLDIERIDRVVKPAGVVRDRQAAVLRRDHLGESAGFERRWHEDEVTSCIGEVGELFVEVPHGDAVMEPAVSHDVVEVTLEISARDDDDLHVVVCDQAVKDLREQLATLLNRVEARWPVKHRNVRIALESEALLEFQFVLPLPINVVLRAEVSGEVRVGGGIEDRIRSVQNPGGTAAVLLASEFVANRIRDEPVIAANDFIKEGRAYGIDVVGGEDSAREEIDGIVFTAFFVGKWSSLIEEVVPEISGIDPTVLDVGEAEMFGVNVVNGEQTGDAVTAGDGGDEARHPVVAMDQIRAHLRNGVVDHLALECEGDQVILGTIDTRPVVEDAVLGKMDALFGECSADLLVFVVEDARDIEVKHSAVIGQGYVNVSALIIESFYKRGGYVGEPACFGAHPLSEVPHAFRKVGDFRSDDENPRTARWIF